MNFPLRVDKMNVAGRRKWQLCGFAVQCYKVPGKLGEINDRCSPSRAMASNIALRLIFMPAPGCECAESSGKEKKSGNQHATDEKQCREHHRLHNHETSRARIASSKRGPSPGKFITTSTNSDALRSDAKESEQKRSREPAAEGSA